MQLKILRSFIINIVMPKQNDHDLVSYFNITRNGRGEENCYYYMSANKLFGRVMTDYE